MSAPAAQMSTLIRRNNHLVLCAAADGNRIIRAAGFCAAVPQRALTLVVTLICAVFALVLGKAVLMQSMGMAVYGAALAGLEAGGPADRIAAVLMRADAMSLIVHGHLF